jgi:hypothetical protein
MALPKGADPHSVILVVQLQQAGGGAGILSADA